MKIGLGGGCHWCTEGVFNSLLGVNNVEQGWIAPIESPEDWSEGIIVHWDSQVINLTDLIQAHLITHASTVPHSMRSKYRSAIYVFDKEQEGNVNDILNLLEEELNQTFITEVIAFGEFKLNEDEFLNYFYSRPDAPFCKNHIHPKIEKLRESFANQLNEEKLKGISNID